MSRENVELARRAAANMRALEELLDEDVVWDNTRFRGPIPLDHVGVTVGKKAVVAQLRAWVSTWRDFSFEVEELIDAGRSVVLVVRERGSGRASGVPLDNHYAQVWAFRNGRIVAGAAYEGKEHALRAADRSD
jgi:ketosteroid isomerase-like protein